MNIDTNLHVIKELTPKQQSIVDNMTYPNFVKAGAGTGKTEVVVQKILKLLETNNATLDQFAIITFTNKATNEMKERLIDRLYLSFLKKPEDQKLRRQIEISNILDISTIHSFCEKIIRKYGININIPNNFVISSFKFEIDEIISDILNEYSNEPVFQTIQLFKLKDYIKRYYNENENRGLIIPDNAVEKLVFTTKDEYWNEFRKKFLEVYIKCYHEIESKKKEYNVLTQNDLIKYCAILLQDKYIAKNVATKYKYLFIDEFQDTSIDQFKLVKAFIDNGVKVFVVGDEKQSIYKFRGSDISSFYEMTDVISEIKKNISEDKQEIFINENFRTDYTLLTHINTVFNSQFHFGNIVIPFKNLALDKTKELKREPDAMAKPFQVCYNANLPELIKELIDKQSIKGKPIRYKDIAILCRRNSDLDEHAEQLKKEGIPVEVVGGKGFYRAKEIIDTYKMLNAIINKGKIDLEELRFTDYYKAYSSTKNNFYDLINELSITIRENVISTFLDTMYKKTGILKYNKYFNNLQANANLQKLQNISREKMYEEGVQPVDFLQYLDIMISTNQEEDEAELSKKDREEGAVSLYSIHRAKGLDFKIVIIPDFDLNLNRSATKPKIISIFKDDKIQLAFNSFYLFSDDDEKRNSDPMFDGLIRGYTLTNLEEEVRILYVAMTRAKHGLIIANSRPKYSIIEECNRNKYYVSYFRWLNEIQDGKFIEKFE